QFGGDLQQGQGAAHVAVGGGGDLAQAFLGHAQPLPAQATLAVVQGAAQGQQDVLRRDRLQHVHAAAREQRRVQLEAGILGGGADEQDAAAFDVRQEGVLLRLVEAVHLVHEQDGAPALG